VRPQFHRYFSPFYGRGISESQCCSIALRDVPRESYTLCTKLGRYDLQHFDFSAKRVAESVDVSLHRLGTTTSTSSSATT
jgi:aryl-alcohol dehydrogenase-like predicted oxidoreductase